MRKPAMIGFVCSLLQLATHISPFELHLLHGDVFDKSTVTAIRFMHQLLMLRHCRTALN
jgi:hypothetical protein